MKKYFNISLLLVLALAFAATSCKNEVDDIFDKDAVTRLDDIVDEYYGILTKDGDSTKWQLEYFANEDEPGYVYVMTFYKNGSVRMSGMNEWIGNVNGNGTGTIDYGTAVSLWDIITDNGPVLSFNTYNKYFHLFASPEDIPSLSEEDTDETGYGHSGDYEFDLMKYSNDTLYLTGKKHEIDMIMTRISNTTDDKVYMNEVVAMADSFFNSHIPHVYIVLPDGNRWIVEDGASSILTMYNEKRDRITTMETHNVIITHDGLSFMEPVELDGYVVQNFRRQADGSLLCRDDNQTIMIADELADVVMNQSLVWRFDLKDIGGEFTTCLSNLSSQLTAYNKSSLVYIQSAYNLSLGKYTLTFNVKKGATKYNPTYYFNIERVGDTQIKFAFESEGDAAGKVYATKCPAIQDMINLFNGNTFNLDATSLLAPTTITVGNNSGYTVWNLQ